MTVYVDNSMIRWKGREWCHLTADTLTELHTFAARLGLRSEWFQTSKLMKHPHYDVTASKRREALRLGALPESWDESRNRLKELKF